MHRCIHMIKEKSVDGSFLLEQKVYISFLAVDENSHLINAKKMSLHKSFCSCITGNALRTLDISFVVDFMVLSLLSVMNSHVSLFGCMCVECEQADDSTQCE